MCSRFHTDPSGTFVKYDAKAIGSGSEGAQTALQENYRCDYTHARMHIVAVAPEFGLP
jgi:20S proteasome subunit alpha 5